MYTVRTKQTDHEIKESHLKRLEKLSIKSIGEIPQLEEPTDEQQKWINRRIRASARSWEVWHQK